MILPALTASLMMFAAAPDTALAYAEALARAEKYEADATATTWRSTQLGPLLSKAMPKIFESCAPGENTTGRPNFTVVLSFKGSAFEAVRSTSDVPIAQCVVGKMSVLKWPTPPKPDFAEELHFEMDPK